MIRVIETSQYENYYSSVIIGLPHTPFQTPYWAKVHEKYFNDKSYFIYLENNNRFVAGLFLFELSTIYGNIYFSHGRFGTAGLILHPKNKPSHLTPLVKTFKDTILKEIDPNPITISLGNLQTGYHDECEIKDFKAFCRENNGTYCFRNNQIVNLKELAYNNPSQDLIEGNPLIPGRSRRNINRNLRLSNKNKIVVNDKITTKTIKTWHEIHLKRMREIEGNPWPLQFFISAIETKPSNFCKFFSAYHKDNLVGGAFCFYNNYALDIFMISSLKKYLSLGTNHALSYNIYQWCQKMGIKYINWQASNPPDGGVFKFKKQWMAQDHTMHSINLIIDKARFELIDIEELIQIYPDRFLFPIC